MRSVAFIAEIVSDQTGGTDGWGELYKCPLQASAMPDDMAYAIALLDSSGSRFLGSDSGCVATFICCFADWAMKA